MTEAGCRAVVVVVVAYLDSAHLLLLFDGLDGRESLPIRDELHQCIEVWRFRATCLHEL